jgi:GT2 family glycosyltransferase
MRRADVRLLVPRRPDGGHRDRLWAWCRGFWGLAGFDIVEGLDEDGPFNRSAALNRAAEGDWEVAVVLDGDSYCDPPQVDEAVKRARETGSLALAFSHRLHLAQAGTERVINHKGGSLDRYIMRTQGPDDKYRYVSGCLAVPRELWDAVGGFDERFKGWGGEDDAFFAACTALSGHDARQDPVSGPLWHLWHEPSLWLRAAPLYRQARALARRYTEADAEEVRVLLAEPRDPNQIVLVCVTTGRRDTLAATLASADKKLRGPIGRRLLLVDAATTDLRPAGWDVVCMGRSQGYAVAMERAIEQAIGSGQPWVFWLEDDFTFNRVVHLGAMQTTMQKYPDLAQLVLLRQPWYEGPETDAGSVLGDRRYSFEQRNGHVVHRNYWSMNPMLTRREVLARHVWMPKDGAELRFGKRVLADPTVRVAYAGHLDQEPAVTHNGREPAGANY